MKNLRWLGVLLAFGTASAGAASAQIPVGVEEAQFPHGPTALGIQHNGEASAIDGDTVVLGGPRSGNFFQKGVVLVYTRSGNAWPLAAGFTGGDSTTGDQFGVSVSLSNGTLLAGARYDDDLGDDSGSAYVFVGGGSTWSEEAKLTASDGTAGDAFGTAVVVQGDTVVIGAPGHSTESGAAYVFVRNGIEWTQQAKLVASDGDQDDVFGTSVSLFGDTVLVGATAADGAVADTGAAYVFVRNGTVWSQQAKLSVPGSASGDQFGFCVSLYEDRAVAGAPFATGAAPASGAVYTFARSGSSWSPEGAIHPVDGEGDDRFGWSVALAADTVLAGAPQDDDNYVLSGSGYVYVRAGGAWVLESKLLTCGSTGRLGWGASISGDLAILGAPEGYTKVGPHTFAKGAAYTFRLHAGPHQNPLVPGELSPPPSVGSERFGQATAISGDTVLVSAPWRDSQGRDSGSAFVYVASGTDWALQAELLASNGAEGDRFGYTVALDGDTAVVGASYYPSKDTVYVFVRNGTVWSEQAILLPPEPQPSFGRAVAISGDTIVVGAPEDDDLGYATGSATVFVRSGTTWSVQRVLFAFDAVAGDHYGSSVAISGDVALIGAPLDFTGGKKVGSAYLYHRTGTTWGQDVHLKSNDASEFDEFGSAVSVSGDTAAIGARHAPGSGQDAGAAYVFEHRGGIFWLQTAKLFPKGGVLFDRYGDTISISGDSLVVGAWWQGTGSAFTYSRSGGAWSLREKFVPPDAAPGDFIGASVSVSGRVAVVGAPGACVTGSDSGSAYTRVIARPPTSYCTGKVNSLGCMPAIGAIGFPRATDVEGFTVSATHVQNSKTGMLVYTLAGRAAVPFQGGTLCLAAPILRSPPIHSGGPPPPVQNCGGGWRLDMNAFAAGLLGGAPHPGLRVPGTIVHCQWWGRDPGDAFGSALTDALLYEIAP